MASLKICDICGQTCTMIFTVSLQRRRVTNGVASTATSLRTGEIEHCSKRCVQTTVDGTEF